jgi:Salmonella virulence plasmid 65kDa B protein
MLVVETVGRIRREHFAKGKTIKEIARDLGVCASINERILAVLLLASFILTPAGPVFAAFGGGLPTIPNPSVFGSSIADPKVDGATGAFTQQVPLDIPPGRNGLQPDISLQYNSQNTSDGIVGYSWSLSIPYIQRLNKTGSQDLYGSNPYFTSSLDGELALDGTNTPAINATAAPSILDTTPLTLHQAANTTSDSFPYTVPAGGTNKLLVVEVGANDSAPPSSMTLNGVVLTVKSFGTNGSGQFFGYSYGYLAAPTSGTFTITWPAARFFDYVPFTMQQRPLMHTLVANSTCRSGFESVSLPASRQRQLPHLIRSPRRYMIKATTLALTAGSRAMATRRSIIRSAKMSSTFPTT